ncbi:MAG TPA: energy transducer TonB [Granulicella sp.]|jgi:protein TonB
MFEGSLIESTAVLQTRNRWPTVISVAIQALIAATIVAVPLLHPEVIKLHAPTMTLFAPPPRPHEPPPPPPQRVHLAPTDAMSTSTPTPAAPTNAQSQIPRTLIADNNTGEAPPTNPLGLGIGNQTVLSALSSSGGSPSPHVVVASTAPKGPILISRGVSSGMLLAPIRPDYPQIAKATHTEGIVIVQAVISKAGTIESAHVVSGPALLQGAALAAVRSAHYKPYLLNDQPTEVETTFSISFKISG